VLEALIPPRLRLPLHVGLIRHGRTVCSAGRPFCEDCALQHICPSAPYYLGKRKLRGTR
jgi:endonuclease-3